MHRKKKKKRFYEELYRKISLFYYETKRVRYEHTRIQNTFVVEREVLTH